MRQAACEVAGLRPTPQRIDEFQHFLPTEIFKIGRYFGFILQVRGMASGLQADISLIELWHVIPASNDFTRVRQKTRSGMIDAISAKNISRISASPE